ncbi:zeta toxin family protein [Alloscardovia venturai]|uniref:UDP-N-acetylglucosamine kinase n=1 Tax=Alloscardovia venturai TaxID=1769421 RepID=A0ABW2Y484_9BIFI
MTEYSLLEAELEQIFDTEIAPEIPLSNSDSVPTIILVGTQPDAGKTQAVNAASREHNNAYQVVGDDLRKYHPAYRQLMDTDPLAMPDATAQASDTWVEMSLDYLKTHKQSLILETTMRHKNAVQKTLEEFKQAGYKTEVVIVSTPPQVSLMSTLTRYIGQVEQFGAGRFVNPKIHDEAVKNLETTIVNQTCNGNIDILTITNRPGELHTFDLH